MEFVRAATVSSHLDPEPNTLQWPRILALHGGGTNQRIFKAQCRVVEASLRAHGFRLVYAEAPFPSVPGPDVLSVYSRWGLFKAWLRSPDVCAPSSEDIYAVEDAIATTVHADDLRGASGVWVAVMGFSQGAKIAASLLLRQQQQQQNLTSQFRFRFGILFAGRGPLLNLSSELQTGEKCTRLVIPTIHVHGRRDPGLADHRKMYELCCDPAAARLVTWDGDHRLPIKTKDVQKIVSAILEIVKSGGSLEDSPGHVF
ncbi:alpha/beta-hydrolase [Thozetella sp. PMI_491]|nr:alpha/beta-hydrolase [Thozetella sp. PMI_491]